VFSLTHIRNTGAAWSMMSGKTWFLIGLPVVVLIAAVIYMYKIRKGSKLKKQKQITNKIPPITIQISAKLKIGKLIGSNLI